MDGRDRPDHDNGERGLAVRSRVASASCLAATAVAAMLGFSDMVSVQQPALGRQMLEAATRGDATTVRKLIGAGSPLDPVDASKRTPLLIAVERDELEIATLLIEAGANVDAQAANRHAFAAGRRAWACCNASPDHARKPDLSLRIRFGGNALIPACERAHVEAVEGSADHPEWNVNHIDDLGSTCLFEDRDPGRWGPSHVEVAKLVLATGANTNIADKDGVSPLIHAKRKGQGQVAALIEAAGGR